MRRHERSFIVDAMSTFGAVPIDFAAAGIDFLISSANKCLEGVPGFCFVFARRAALLACDGNARSLSLDLAGQLKGFEKNGQFRFTPPTHAILAFAQALKEFEQEGGVEARAARYRRNHTVLIEGMKALGFEVFLDPGVQSYIITSFHHPKDSGFTFEEFYQRLSDKGFIIYPGKISHANLFRIGTVSGCGIGARADAEFPAHERGRPSRPGARGAALVHQRQQRFHRHGRTAVRARHRREFLL